MKRYRIGHADTNENGFNEPSVSREHAELIKLSRGAFQPQNLGSTYGTSARQGSDRHLITAENVNYDTPLRIGVFGTTVAELPREVDPRAANMGPSPEPPWAKPEPRLPPDERAQHPETIHVGWPLGEEPAHLFWPQRNAGRARVWARRHFLVVSLIGIGAIAMAAVMTAAASLG
jgi:hypothetical protein